MVSTTSATMKPARITKMVFSTTRPGANTGRTGRAGVKACQRFKLALSIAPRFIAKLRSFGGHGLAQEAADSDA